MVVPLPRIFAQQPPIAAVIPLLDRSTSLEAQNSIIEALDGVDDRFREQVLKHLVKLVEQKGSDEDVAEELWEAYYALKTPAALAKLRETTDSLVRYDLPDNKRVVIREDRSTLVQAGGTGHRTWESSLALTEFICVNTDLRDLGQVVELGAGTGLVGMAIAKLGAADSVHSTDGSAQLVAKLSDIIEENQLESVVRPSVLQWQDLGEADKLPKGAVVVAGDVLYGLSSLYYILIDCLEVLQPRKVLLANPIRNEEAYESFKELCRARGVGIKTVAQYSASSSEETDWMFLVSLPPIPLEIVELSFDGKSGK